MRDNPIATSIRLIPIESVPFPAVLVDPGVSDRMAVLKQSRNMASEEDLQEDCKHDLSSTSPNKVGLSNQCYNRTGQCLCEKDFS